MKLVANKSRIVWNRIRSNGHSIYEYKDYVIAGVYVGGVFPIVWGLFFNEAPIKWAKSVRELKKYINTINKE